MKTKTKLLKTSNNSLAGEAGGPIDLSDPGIFWVNGVDEYFAKEFCSAVLRYSAVVPNRPIIMYIDSYGGELHALMTMISVLDAVPNQLVTVSLGKAMSAGAALLSHGDIRFVSPNTRVMIHKVSAGTAGNIDDMNNEVIESNEDNKSFLKLIAKNCKYKGGFPALDKMLSNSKCRDLYMNADRCIEFGIADQIGVPRVLDVTTHTIIY
jgi:ATP-dependent Clp protease protease subunit